MKKFLGPALLLLSLQASAQRQKFSVGLFYQPDPNFYYVQADNNTPKTLKFHWNSGTLLDVGYSIRTCLAIHAGVLYSSKSYYGFVFQQGALPEPRRSSTFELLTAQPASYPQKIDLHGLRFSIGFQIPFGGEK